MFANGSRPNPVADRLPGIDVWRGTMLAGLGIVVHCADLFDPLHTPWAGMIAVGSGSFRMEVFFALAGYLAVGSQERNPVGWTAQRMLQLGIPFITGWLIVLPGWNLAVDLPLWDPAAIAHLWFLPVLAACSLLPRIRMPVHTLYPTAIAVLTVTIPIVNRMPNEWVVMAVKVPYYALFYFAGQHLVGRAPPAPAWWVPAIGLLAGFVYAFGFAPALFSDPARPIWVKLLTHAAPAIVAPAFTMAVFSSALTLASAPRHARHLAGAAYTVYVVHLGVIGLLFATLRSRVADDVLLFALLCVLTAAVTLAFHFVVVKRHPFAGFLFNGLTRLGTPLHRRQYDLSAKPR